MLFCLSRSARICWNWCCGKEGTGKSLSTTPFPCGFIEPLICALPLQEGDQEPFDITVNWTKLTVLPYKDLANNTVGEDIVRLIEDEDDLNWEIKVH